LNSVRHARLWIGATAGSTLLLAAACAWLPRGFAQTATSDILTAVLISSVICAFILGARASKGRTRWFWILQAIGWTLWFADQMVWTTFDVILRWKMPAMYPADALLFLAGAPMIAGLLLRPHRQPSERSARLGALDFLMLFLWWLYLYVAFVVCWQYVSPNEAGYNRNFDVLAGSGTILEVGIVAMFWRRGSGPWKKFYLRLCGAVAFYGVTFYLLNFAIERGVYYTGSWYDVPYALSFVGFTAAALSGYGLTATPDGARDESFHSLIANLAMFSVLSLPIIAVIAIFDSRLGPAVSHFRVVVTLVTMFLMAAILFIQHYRLNRELRRTNVVLQEASLTDPLTGLRNRRYFSATIEADVGQALRSHADGHDPHTRDLVFYLIDADNFKEVNDRYGHDVGDAVLIEMSRRLSSSIRHSDVLVRWGGEEFLVVSRYTDRREAELLAQRVLSAVGDTPFVVGPQEEKIYRTCSLGWAAFPWYTENPKAVSYEEVLTLADRGLNRAKNAGRNRAVGMNPARGKAGTPIEGTHSVGLQVDVLAVVGPKTET